MVMVDKHSKTWDFIVVFFSEKRQEFIEHGGTLGWHHISPTALYVWLLKIPSLIWFFLIPGLWSWLFPSSLSLFTLNLGIRLIPPASAASEVTPASPQKINLDLSQPPENLLLETFGPGTFATPEEVASDEANDDQLYYHMVESIRIWQRNKRRHHR